MSEAIDKISEDLLKAQKVMGKALKDSNNPFFKSKYADINSVLDAVIPALNDNNISVWQPTVVEDNRKYVKTIFLHTSGQFLAGLTEIVYVKELDPQQQVAAITYARRGGLQSMANIGGEDDDGATAAGKTSKDIPSDKPSRFARKSKDTAKQPEADSVKDVPNTSQDSSQATSSTDEGQDKQAPTKTSFRRFKRG